MSLGNEMQPRQNVEGDIDSNFPPAWLVMGVRL